MLDCLDDIGRNAWAPGINTCSIFMAGGIFGLPKMWVKM